MKEALDYGELSPPLGRIFSNVEDMKGWPTNLYPNPMEAKGLSSPVVGF